MLSLLLFIIYFFIINVVTIIILHHRCRSKALRCVYHSDVSTRTFLKSFSLETRRYISPSEPGTPMSSDVCCSTGLTSRYWTRLTIHLKWITHSLYLLAHFFYSFPLIHSLTLTYLIFTHWLHVCVFQFSTFWATSPCFIILYSIIICLFSGRAESSISIDRQWKLWYWKHPGETSIGEHSPSIHIYIAVFVQFLVDRSVNN